MSKKITKEEFLRRFSISFPEEEIEIIEFNGMSNPTTIRCKKCGKIHNKKKANYFLSNYRCCDDNVKSQYKKIIEILNKEPEFTLVKKIDRNNVIIYHSKCKNEFKRSIQSVLKSPTACPHCKTGQTRNMLSIDEIQQRLDKKFNKEIKILEYNGQLKKNYYKCLKCGLIFKTSQVCIEQSRGCPKCDKKQSNGEKKMKEFLLSRGLNFQEQVRVKDLPLQSFDFGVFDKDNNLICFIEVNGEQHYMERPYFKESLQVIQERDNRKRQYCDKNNIPLYEIKWFKGKFIDLDKLPF